MRARPQNDALHIHSDEWLETPDEWRVYNTGFVISVKTERCNRRNGRYKKSEPR